MCVNYAKVDSQNKRWITIPGRSPCEPRGLQHSYLFYTWEQKRVIIIIDIQPLDRSGQRPELSQATGMALVRCILGKFLGVACHCFPPRLDVPTFHHEVPPRPPRRERSERRKWELWARMLSGNFAEMTTSTPFRDLLHAANLRHGTDGFTSPPKEVK